MTSDKMISQGTGSSPFNRFTVIWGSLNDRLTCLIATYAQGYDQGKGQITDKMAKDLLNESLVLEVPEQAGHHGQADKYLISALPG